MGWRKGAILMSGDSNVISAFTIDQAARLSGLNEARLRYWDNENFFHPSYGYEDRSVQYSRVYSFNDVVCLRTLAILVKEHKIRLPVLRETLVGLLAMDQGRWATETLYVLGQRVYFQRPDDKNFQETTSSQLALHNIPLRKVIGEVTKAVRHMKERDPATIGKIAKVRNVQGSEPVIEGTRIPARTIRDYLEEGYEPGKIIEEFPSLTPKDIEAVRRHFRLSAA